MNVSLDQIRDFLTAASTNSFTRAAATLCLSQPALTMRIRQFESNLRIRVFDRNTRSVQLTRTGRELLPVFQRLLAQFDAAIANARNLADSCDGVVRVASLPTVAGTLLTRFISRFRERFPRTTFVLKDAVNSRVRELVRNEEVDIGIVHHEGRLQEFDVVDLFEDRMLAVYPIKSPLAKTAKLTVNTLVRYPLILMDQQTSWRALLDKALIAAGQVVTPACEAKYTSPAIGMVRAGLGVAVVPSTGVDPALYPDVRFRPVEDAILVRQICAITRKGSRLMPMAGCFLDMLTTQFECARTGRTPRRD